MGEPYCSSGAPPCTERAGAPISPAFLLIFLINFPCSCLGPTDDARGKLSSCPRLLRASAAASTSAVQMWRPRILPYDVRLPSAEPRASALVGAVVQLLAGMPNASPVAVYLQGHLLFLERLLSISGRGRPRSEGSAADSGLSTDCLRGWAFATYRSRSRTNCTRGALQGFVGRTLPSRGQPIWSR